MKRNPLLKAEEKIITKVYGNTATMVYDIRTRTYDKDTGAISETETMVRKEFHFADPHVVSETSADGKKYMIGDIIFTSPYMEFQRNLNSLPADYATARKSPFGIDIASDTIEVFDRSYRIIKITPQEVYAGVPAKIKIQIREGSL